VTLVGPDLSCALGWSRSLVRDRRDRAQRAAKGWSEGTISRPSGISEMGMSLRFAQAKGMPTIVTARAMLVARWPRASHQPAKISQMTLPTKDAPPASGRSRVVRPNGHRT
jgi:hypothetical protein